MVKKPLDMEYFQIFYWNAIFCTEKNIVLFKSYILKLLKELCLNIFPVQMNNYSNRQKNILF